MGIIEVDIALESWLFGFWPSSGQGQFTLPQDLMLPRFTVGTLSFTVSTCRRVPNIDITPHFPPLPSSPHPPCKAL